MSPPGGARVGAGGDRPALSLVVIVHNMARELPRTLRSLSPLMQRGIQAEDYEVIVVDNGSRPPCDASACQAWLPGLRLAAQPDPQPSPVPAINLGLTLARADLIGVMIDGARLASPGLLRGALEAARLHPRAVIGAANLHLGPDAQRFSILQGYNQAREDELLARVDWTRDGYRLFEIASFGRSYARGWLGTPSETNSLFLTRRQWDELGGYDERFRMPGGGLANLDMWRRACLAPASQPILLLGEGTFHQLHGGVATNAGRHMFPEFAIEYQQIRGQPFRPPEIELLYLGRLHPAVLPSLAWSAQQAQALASPPGSGSGAG